MPALATTPTLGLSNLKDVDTHSPQVAMAIDAAVTQLNNLRVKARKPSLRVINIISAKRGHIPGTGHNVYVVTLQLRKTGGRMEFRVFEIAETPPAEIPSSDVHPPMAKLPPTSEAIIVTTQFHPVSTTSFQGPATFKLLHNHIIVSPFSMHHRRSTSSLERVPGSATAVMKAIRESRKVAPVPTPPA